MDNSQTVEAALQVELSSYSSSVKQLYMLLLLGGSFVEFVLQLA